MSNEAMIGIIVTIVVGIAGFFAYSTRKSIKINQSNGNGTQNMNNNIIANDINTKKSDKDK